MVHTPTKNAADKLTRALTAYSEMIEPKLGPTVQAALVDFVAAIAEVQADLLSIATTPEGFTPPANVRPAQFLSDNGELAGATYTRMRACESAANALEVVAATDVPATKLERQQVILARQYRRQASELRQALVDAELIAVGA